MHASHPGLNATIPIGELYELYSPRVRRFFRFLGCDYSPADDLTHEMFLKMFDRPVDFCGVTSVQGVLFQRARWALSSYHRRNRRNSGAEIMEHDAVDERWAGKDEGDSNPALDALRAALPKTPEKYQAVLRMRYDEAASCDKIAAEMGVTLHTAKRYLRDAKNRVRCEIRDRAFACREFSLIDRMRQRAKVDGLVSR